MTTDINQIPNDWNTELDELETFFKSVSIPESIQLNTSTKIINVEVFIKNSLMIARSQNGSKTYKPYLTRLNELKQLLN